MEDTVKLWYLERTDKDFNWHFEWYKGFVLAATEEKARQMMSNYHKNFLDPEKSTCKEIDTSKEQIVYVIEEDDESV